MIAPCVHMGLGNGFQIAVGEELGALNALWFPFLNHFGLKNTKDFVLLKRGRANHSKIQVLANCAGFSIQCSPQCRALCRLQGEEHM